MELSYVQENLNSHFKWDMASLRGQQGRMGFDYQQSNAISHINNDSELSGRSQSSSDTHLHALEEEFRRLLVCYKESLDLGQILDRDSSDSWGLDEEGGEDSVGIRGSMKGGGLSGLYEASDLDVRVASTPQDLDSSSTPRLSGANSDLMKVAITSMNKQSDGVVHALLPSDVISDLHSIASHMVNAGCTKECQHAFVSIRKSMIENTLSDIGLDNVALDDVQKITWEDLEMRIVTWVRALKVAIWALYPSEKALCYQVFGSSGSDGLSSEELFLEISRGSLLRFMSFAEGVAVGRRLPEKLFRILDMYETLSELHPRIESIFSDDVFASARFEVNGTIMRLGEAVRGIFAEFENAIQRESSRIPVPGGAIHPLTKYVMNYITFLGCYIGPLKCLLGEKRKKRTSLSALVGDDDEDAHRVNHLSPLGVQIVWLIVLLECNLDAKSKLYKDVAQAYFFLMNNAHYILQKVRTSDVASLLGEDWVLKQSYQVVQHATNYMRSGWKRVLGFVRDEGSSSMSMSKGALRDRLKGFYACLEDTCRAQSSWVVPDLELREELRISIAEKVISAYQSFLTRHHAHLDLGKQQDRYLKYTPEELERCLLDLFEGACFAPRRSQRVPFS